MKHPLFTNISRLVLCACASGLLAVGCSQTPNQPSVSFTSPTGTGPAAGSSIRFKSQPVTLTLTNATKTAAAAVTYTVEVATDAAFANKVSTTSSIPEGSGGTTSVTVGNLSAASGDTTYYWRSFSTVDGVTGSPSASRTFVIQQQIVLGAPAQSTPASAATVNDPRPQFVVRNASRQGATGAITYVFQVSPNSSFSPITTSATVSEGPGGANGTTTWTPSVDLTDGNYFWRAQARDDSNGEASAFNAAAALTLQSFDPKKARFVDNYSDIGSWPETAKITLVSFEPDGIYVDFDKRTGPGRWPEVGSATFGPLQYTLGLCFNLGGQWYCSAAIQFWDGRDLNNSGPWGQIADLWYYDARWLPMTGHQPAIGELVAVWAGHGNLRGVGGNTQAMRTNFKLIKWGTGYDVNAGK